MMPATSKLLLVMPKPGKSAESCGHRHHCENDTFTTLRYENEDHRTGRGSSMVVVPLMMIMNGWVQENGLGSSKDWTAKANFLARLP